MQPRAEYAKIAPDAFKRMLHLSAYLNSCSLEKSLINLIKIRASQINHCAFCINMHWQEAQAAHEDEQRLYLLNAWQEAPCYSERERAALAWTEAVTLLSEGQTTDSLYEQVREHFTETEIVDLTFAIVIINSWNRLAAPFRSVPVTHRPQEIAQ